MNILILNKQNLFAFDSALNDYIQYKYSYCQNLFFFPLMSNCSLKN